MHFMLVRAFVIILNCYIYAWANISTHILDTGLGQPAGNVPVTIYRLDYNNQWLELNQAVTDTNGRIQQLLQEHDIKNGQYKLKFHVETYFQLKGLKSIYPFIEVTLICEATENYHVPLLLSPFSYTTYRGS